VVFRSAKPVRATNKHVGPDALVRAGGRAQLASAGEGTRPYVMRQRPTYL
jgi:hypothetical protein